MAIFKGKTSTTPAAAPAKAPVLAPAPKAAAAAPKAAAPAKKVDATERQRMIAEAAFYIAEKRGFAPGNHNADWAEAERQIDELLKKQK